MKKKFLFMLLTIGIASCNNAVKDPMDQEKILNLKNATNADINLLMVNNTDTLSMLLSPNSIFELVGLKDNCNSFEYTLKDKIDYLSYQKGNSRPTVLIDKKNNVFLTDLDILKSKGTFTYSNDGSNKNTVKRVVADYPLE